VVALIVAPSLEPDAVASRGGWHRAGGPGVAKAHEIGREEGWIAGLVMVLVGLLNVLLALTADTTTLM
jgi:putative effector of murein hydrolase